MRDAAIEDAFDALLREGVEPSVRKVRERAGGGSLTDIHRVVQRLRTERAAVDGSPLPMAPETREKADRFVMQLWAGLAAEAMSSVEDAKVGYRARIRELECQLDAALQDADTLQSDLDRSVHERAELAGRLERSEAEVGKARTDVAVLSQRVADLGARADEFQKLVAAAFGSGRSMRTVPALTPTLERVRVAIVEAVTEHGPIPIDSLDTMVRNTGPLAGKRLRSAVEDLVARGVLLFDGDAVGVAEPV